MDLEDQLKGKWTYIYIYIHISYVSGPMIDEVRPGARGKSPWQGQNQSASGWAEHG